MGLESLVRSTHHSILDLTAGELELIREEVEVDVDVNGSLGWDEAAPELGPLIGIGCVEPEVEEDPPGERLVHAGFSEVGCNNHPPVVPLDRLEDEDEAVRFYAIAALVRMTGTDLGYKYYRPQRERLAAVKRWRDHVRTRARTGPTTRTASFR